MDKLTHAGLALVAAVAWTLALANAAADEAEGPVLRGIVRVAIEVEGIRRDFERYGLTAAEVRHRAEARLAERGVTVIDAETARADPGAAMLRIKLSANRDQYAFYFYAVSVQVRRRVPLAGAGSASVTRTVWSKGRHGVINPSDWPRLYGYVDEMLDTFAARLGRDNAGAAGTARRAPRDDRPRLTQVASEPGHPPRRRWSG